MNDSTLLWAPSAWLPGGWRQSVLLEAGGDGLWSRVVADVADPPPRAQRLAGPALPGLVNAHSHAFQRAFAGLAERRELDVDDFWSWREQLYRVAHRIDPVNMQAVAAQLYIELLHVGYTHICEFHYLQHRPDGSLYQDPLEMSWALARAAVEAGVHLTLLPVLYERAGLNQSALAPEQRRFRADADQVWAMQSAIGARQAAGVRAGLAIHSLRAASPESIARVRELAERFSGPIHIHAAEQMQEVEQCVQHLGARPIEWLARYAALDARWQLVHATHASEKEVEMVARSGAGVVLCPTTEANLGDGLTDLPAWLAAGVPISIGSDSHVTRSWREELRWLEYGQRLAKRRRNIAAAPAAGVPSSAARLFERVVQGGAAAAGFTRWGLQVGARADLLVTDMAEPSLLGVPQAMLLDVLVFSSPGRAWRDVMVAGHWQIKDHDHPLAGQLSARFEQAMSQLWSEAYLRSVEPAVGERS
ncbi:MAG: formimidoylglutamate deiminase [Burkholderiaceae bacterium]|nr:formimidoylglutamate deiminase [Burkholderiaceae bacterium]